MLKKIFGWLNGKPNKIQADKMAQKDINNESLSPGDLVKVWVSPGAPFDIGEIFTVEEFDDSHILSVKVKERRHYFSKLWVEKIESGKPSFTMEQINGHDWLHDYCVNCGAQNTMSLCPGPRI